MAQEDKYLADLEKECEKIKSSPSVVKVLNSILRCITVLSEEMREFRGWKQVSDEKISMLIERNKNSPINRRVMEFYLSKIKPLEEYCWDTVFNETWDMRILRALTEEPISKSKLAQRLGFKSRTPLDHVSNAPYPRGPNKVLDKMIRDGMVNEEGGYSLSDTGLKIKHFIEGKLDIQELLI